MSAQTLKITAVIVTAIGLAPFGVAEAVELIGHADPSHQSSLQQDLERISEERTLQRKQLEKQQADACQIARVSLQQQADLVERQGINRKHRHQTMIDRLHSIVIRLQANEQPSLTLPDHIDQLSRLTSQFEVDLQRYVAELRHAANIACNHTAEFQPVLDRTLSALRTARTDAEDITNYVNQEINPTLQQLKEQVPTVPRGNNTDTIPLDRDQETDNPETTGESSSGQEDEAAQPGGSDTSAAHDAKRVLIGPLVRIGAGEGS